MALGTSYNRELELVVLQGAVRGFYVINVIIITINVNCVHDRNNRDGSVCETFPNVTYCLRTWKGRASWL